MQMFIKTNSTKDFSSWSIWFSISVATVSYVCIIHQRHVAIPASWILRVPCWEVTLPYNLTGSTPKGDASLAMIFIKDNKGESKYKKENFVRLTFYILKQDICFPIAIIHCHSDTNSSSLNYWCLAEISLSLFFECSYTTYSTHH